MHDPQDSRQQRQLEKALRDAERRMRENDQLAAQEVRKEHVHIHIQFIPCGSVHFCVACRSRKDTWGSLCPLLLSVDVVVCCCLL